MQDGFIHKNRLLENGVVAPLSATVKTDQDVQIDATAR